MKPNVQNHDLRTRSFNVAKTNDECNTRIIQEIKTMSQDNPQLISDACVYRDNETHTSTDASAISRVTLIWPNPNHPEVPVDRVLRMDADPADMLKNAGNEGAKRSYDDADLADSRSCEAPSGPFTNGIDTIDLLNADFKQTGRRPGGGGGAGPFAHIDGDVPICMRPSPHESAVWLPNSKQWVS